MHYQVKWNVLTSTIEGSDEPAYYNSYVGGKFYRPIESYDDTFKQKLREANLGEKNPMYGKARSEETKRKISQTLKEKTWQ
jgi:hypothetical protein